MNMSAHLSWPFKVAILADVSVGYGTPQVLYMAESFARRFGAEVRIYEPDESERPPVAIRAHVPQPHVALTRIYTVAHPYLMQGRIEYCHRAAELLREYDPDVLLFSTMYGIQVLDRIPMDGKLKIFYGLEDVETYYSYLFPLVRKCDIRIFPEENRRRIYSDRLGIQNDGKPNLIIYNGNNHGEWTPPDERLPRLFYGGSFDKRKNFAEYYLDPVIQQMPIDIYGLVRGFEDNDAVATKLNGAKGGVAYCGYLQSDEAFHRLLSSYLYSIVIWNPDREDHFYACPNKLFDAIACGVPPICAPHPQCVEVVKKWNCGLLMDDWSFDAFRAALIKGLKAAGSEYYREMAHNCRRASKEELSWDRQFEKIIPHVQKHFSQVEIAK